MRRGDRDKTNGTAATGKAAAAPPPPPGTPKRRGRTSVRAGGARSRPPASPSGRSPMRLAMRRTKSPAARSSVGIAVTPSKTPIQKLHDKSCLSALSLPAFGDSWADFRSLFAVQAYLSGDDAFESTTYTSTVPPVTLAIDKTPGLGRRASLKGIVIYPGACKSAEKDDRRLFFKWTQLLAYMLQFRLQEDMSLPLLPIFYFKGNKFVKVPALTEHIATSALRSMTEMASGNVALPGVPDLYLEDDNDYCVLVMQVLRVLPIKHVFSKAEGLLKVVKKLRLRSEATEAYKVALDGYGLTSHWTLQFVSAETNNVVLAILQKNSVSPSVFQEVSGKVQALLTHHAKKHPGEMACSVVRVATVQAKKGDFQIEGLRLSTLQQAGGSIDKYFVKQKKTTLAVQKALTAINMGDGWTVTDFSNSNKTFTLRPPADFFASDPMDHADDVNISKSALLFQAIDAIDGLEIKGEEGSDWRIVDCTTKLLAAVVSVISSGTGISDSASVVSTASAMTAGTHMSRVSVSSKYMDDNFALDFNGGDSSDRRSRRRGRSAAASPVRSGSFSPPPRLAGAGAGAGAGSGAAAAKTNGVTSRR